MDISRKKIISVIIPVYNSESYLRDCVDSVLNQSFGDFEVICVDDGSTDGSRKILEEYARKDPRIHMVCQANSFAGAARNRGIKESVGEYLLFLDSDDLLMPQALERLLTVITETNSDVVRCSARFLDSGKTVDWTLNKRYVKDGETFNWKDKSDSIFYISSGNPWGMLVRHSLVEENKISFLGLPRTEDISFTYPVYLCANKITGIYDQLVLHRVNSGGMEATKAKHPESSLTARKLLREDLVQKGYYREIYKSFSYVACLSYLDMFRSILVSGSNEAYLRRYYDAMLEIFKEYPELKVTFKSDCPTHMSDMYPTFKSLSYCEDFGMFLKEQRAILKKNRKKSEKEYAKKRLYDLNNSKNDLINNIGSRFEKHSGSLKFSIIIPVYNADKYLENCLDHIFKQSYRNFEVICVDDGSTDGSYALLSKYSSKQGLILLHQDNKGAGIARNKGLEAAIGDYILFMDADDWLDYDALSVIYNRMSDNPDCEIGMFSYSKYYNDTHGNMKYLNFGKKHQEVMSFDSDYEFLMQNKLVVPWNKVFKRSFLLDNHLSFTDLKAANDRPFHYAALLKADKVLVFDDILIHYRVNNAASIIGINRSLNFNCHFDAFNLVKDLYHERGAEYYACLVDMTMGDCMHFYDVSPGSMKTPIARSLIVFTESLDLGTVPNLFSHWWYKKYLFMKADYEEVYPLNEMRRLADYGDRDAQYRMFKICEGSESQEYLEKASEQGHSRAMYDFADELYAKERYSEAFILYEKASEDGIKDATFRLAKCYMDGRGTEKDWGRAAYLFRQAAQAGHRQAQLELSDILSKKKDKASFDEAFNICYRHSINGDKNAMYRLALLYRDRGDTENCDRWLKSAADLGHSGAKRILDQGFSPC